MDTRNKAILGMFTLAFCSLAGLQIAGKAIDYTQSSVLGEKTTIESSMPGKRNFVACETNQQCNSGRCDEVRKLCIPKSAPTRTPQNPAESKESRIETLGTTSEYVPCSDLKAIEAKYCTQEKPTFTKKIEGQISCATFKQNLMVFCRPKPTITPVSQ